MTDDELIDQIEAIRAENKDKWRGINHIVQTFASSDWDALQAALEKDTHRMDILRLALKVKPRTTKMILRDISENDQRVVNLTRELVSQ